MKGKDTVIEFLQKHNIADLPDKIDKLENYVRLLQEGNQYVNLISRQADEKVIWLAHILDSLLPIDRLNITNQTILDFGTGGGLPGIPLKILYPEVLMYLLDSRQRKIEALKKIIKKLDLKQCLTIWSRIEEMDKSWNDYFDVVVSRSVKLDVRYLRVMGRLIRTGGRICMYKAKKLLEPEVMKMVEIRDISHELVGTRMLLVMRKEDVPRGT